MSVTPFANPQVSINNLDTLSRYTPGEGNNNKLSYDPKTGLISLYEPYSINTGFMGKIQTPGILTKIYRKVRTEFDTDALDKTFTKAIEILSASYSDNPDESIRTAAKEIESRFAKSLQALVSLVRVYKEEKKDETVRKISTVYNTAIDGYNRLPVSIALKPDRSMVLNAFTIDTLAKAKTRLKREPRPQMSVPEAVKKSLNQSGRVDLTASIMANLAKSDVFKKAQQAYASKEKAAPVEAVKKVEVVKEKEAVVKKEGPPPPPPAKPMAKSAPIVIAKNEPKKAHSLPLPSKNDDLQKELTSSILRRREKMQGNGDSTSI